MALENLQKELNLPEVTGYIISGILLNLLFTLVLPMKHEFHDIVHKLEVVSVIALGFLSFTLWDKTWLPKLRKHIKTIL